MKNEIILILSNKNNYPTTPKGKVEFLFDVYQKAKSYETDCKIKNNLINRIHKNKISRFNRGVVYKHKELFGFKYKSFVNYAPFYQERLIKLIRSIYDYAESNNVLDKEYIELLSNEISNLEYSLHLANEKENTDMAINF